MRSGRNSATSRTVRCSDSGVCFPNTVGSGDHADIRIPGGPAEWGRIFLQGSDLRFVPSVPGQLIIDGGPAAPTALLVDSSGSPTIVTRSKVAACIARATV